MLWNDNNNINKEIVNDLKEIQNTRDSNFMCNFKELKKRRYFYNWHVL